MGTLVGVADGRVAVGEAGAETVGVAVDWTGAGVAVAGAKVDGGAAGVIVKTPGAIVDDGVALIERVAVGDEVAVRSGVALAVGDAIVGVGGISVAVGGRGVSVGRGVAVPVGVDINTVVGVAGAAGVGEATGDRPTINALISGSSTILATPAIYKDAIIKSTTISKTRSGVARAEKS